MPSFDELLQRRTFAELDTEQRQAAAILGLDAASWAAHAARQAATEHADTLLRQHVPLFRYNALEDELQRLKQHVLDREGGGGSSTGGGAGAGSMSRASGGGSNSPGLGGRASPMPLLDSAPCPMCTLAYVAEIRSTEATKEGHYLYEIVLTQCGNEVSVLHKRFSEFVALKQSLTTQLRANALRNETDAAADADANADASSRTTEGAPEPEPEPGNSTVAAVEGGGGSLGLAPADDDFAPLFRTTSSSESMRPYLNFIKMFSFPSKAPLRAAGGSQRLAEQRRPVLAEWLNLVIKLARMEPCINWTVLSWLDLDSARDLSRLNSAASPSSTPSGGAVAAASPPPLELS